MKKTLLCCVLVAACGLVRAQVISTYNETYLHPLQDYTEFAQSFAAAGPVLQDFQFDVAADPTGGPLSIAIFQWSANTFYGSPVGPALYSTTLTRPTVDQSIFLNNIDVPMTTGVEYGVIFNTHGNLNGSLQLMLKQPINTNPTGNIFTYDAFRGKYDAYGYDTEFKATFSATPEAPPFAILGLGFIAVLFRRRPTL